MTVPLGMDIVVTCSPPPNNRMVPHLQSAGCLRRGKQPSSQRYTLIWRTSLGCRRLCSGTRERGTGDHTGCGFIRRCHARQAGEGLALLVGCARHCSCRSEDQEVSGQVDCIPDGQFAD